MKLQRMRKRSSVAMAVVLMCMAVFSFFIEASAAEKAKYSYSYNGLMITMEPSTKLVSVGQTRHSKGADSLQTLLGLGVKIDSLNQKAGLRDNGMTLLRLPEKMNLIKGLQDFTDQLKKEAGDNALTFQPVFEKGQALLIPTAEVLVGFRDGDADAAQAILARVQDELGIISIKKESGNIYLLTIDNPADGRCYEVSRRLALTEGVDFAEPNHLVILLDQNDTADMDLETLQDGLQELITQQSQKTVPALVEPSSSAANLAPNWQVVASLDGEEQSFPPPGWQVRKKNTAPHVFWGKTELRSHKGNHSIYCAASGDEAVQAPGPVPLNTYTLLLSPQMDLSFFEEAYVEVWFYAINELIRNENGQIASGDFSLLIVGNGEKKSVSPLFVGYTNDATTDPTTEKGWRKLLFRIDPVIRERPVQLMFSFVSNMTNPVEGTYLDDIRVIAGTSVGKSDLVNDPYGGRQYELNNTGQIAGQGNGDNDMSVVEAWHEAEVSQDIVVAVIDDGVDLQHPDLNLVTGYNADGTVGGGPLSDSANHGTSVAGNIGAIGKNGIGVVGTAPNVKIMPVNHGSSHVLDFANAIDTAVRNGADILNNSWGFNGAFHKVIELAVRRALAAGKVVLFAAGNGPDRPPFNYDVFFPGNMSGSSDVITVGSTSQTDDHKSASSSDGQFSWGSSFVGDGPDVCAPGPWSYSTDRLGKLGYNDGSSGIDPDYQHNFGGTSASTPKVAGIAALMLSANRQLTPAQVKMILRRSADDIDEPGVDDKTGAGRVNAFRAVQMAKALAVQQRGEPGGTIKAELPKKHAPGPTKSKNWPAPDDDGFQKVLDY